MTSTLLKTSDISIIIPTLNEEANIPILAENLRNCDCERVIADGGSVDNTVGMAGKYGFVVVKTRAGRGAQLNLGAMKSQGKILLFLHADTRLPQNFSASILKAVEKKDAIAGAFRLGITSPTPAMRFITACANLRSRYFQLPYGDQGIFITREHFFNLGMFPDLPIMEDYVFMKKAKRIGKVSILQEQVTTSARRWRQLGVLRTTFINQLIVVGFALKISPERLASLYRR